jgi:putative membrane protein
MRTSVKSSALTLGTGLAALALASTATAPGAYAAAADDVDVVNTETVQVYVKPDGSIESQRVYEQLTLTGTGTTEIENPIEEEGLRDLNGFGTPDVEDGVQNLEVDVDGVERLRSVSEYTGDLPLDIDVEYRLDGELVEPGDVVGADGELEVLYTVRNITAEPQEVSFPDGRGGTSTETVDVPIPMVGSLTTVAPPTFTEVTSEQANMAGDGKGGTKLSFTMTLFPPIGSDTAEFGYTAHISDGVVPSSSVSALPVNPLESPSFKTAGESYESGSETGVKLAEGATEIDANLLRLQAGAGKLLAGLIKLSDGADQLSAGLAGEAAPGARRLSDGAGELNDGLGQIDDGAGQLADGAGRLSDGASDASTGSQQLEDGLRQISDGLGQLSATDGLPKALRGTKRLKAGVDLIIGQVGAVGQPDTLIDGLHRLELGAGLLKGGLVTLKGDGSPETPGLVGAKGGVDQVKAGLDLALAPANGEGVEGGDLAELELGLIALKTNFCSTHPAQAQCSGLVDKLIQGVGASRTKLTTASGGLGIVSAGLGKAIASLTSTPGVDDPNLMDGALALEAGTGKAKGGAIKLRDEGLIPVRAGLAELQAGLTSAVSGVFQLSDGADAAYGGSGDLSDGLGQIADGSGELSDGAGRLAAGTGEASEGSGLLADGAGELAEGLGEAADGSVRLADGMAEARNGAPALVDGAGRLSSEGMSKLIGAGEDTAQDYGKLYATIEAGAERADAEKMAYGAPADATGMTAYTYELLGDDGEASRNTKRGLAALGLLGLGAGAFFLRRRLI